MKSSTTTVAVLLIVTLLLLANLATAIPIGFATFFDRATCPPGWRALNDAQGRLIVSVKDPSQAGVTVNSPLSDQENREHTHTFASTIDVPVKEVSAIDCCNHQAAKTASVPVSGSTHNGSSGYPFTQLLLCALETTNNTESLAFGAIGYFDPNVQKCPKDWVPMEEGNGRFLVPGYSRGGAIPNSAAALAPGEDRLHKHSYSVSFPTRDVSFVGLKDCCDKRPGKNSALTLSGASEATSAGLPYIQLLTCVNQAPTFNQTLPEAALVYNAVSCPPDWEVENSVSGRMMVALPNGGLPGASFGGDSIPPDAPTNPSHKHGISGSVKLPSTGIMLDSGCCGNGYAGSGEYTFEGVSDSASENLPYTLLPMCRYSPLKKKASELLKTMKK